MIGWGWGRREAPEATAGATSSSILFSKNRTHHRSLRERKMAVPVLMLAMTVQASHVSELELLPCAATARSFGSHHDYTGPLKVRPAAPAPATHHRQQPLTPCR
jgi:hypothetical protein